MQRIRNVSAAVAAGGPAQVEPAALRPSAGWLGLVARTLVTPVAASRTRGPDVAPCRSAPPPNVV